VSILSGICVREYQPFLGQFVDIGTGLALTTSISETIWPQSVDADKQYVVGLIGKGVIKRYPRYDSCQDDDAYDDNPKSHFDS